MVKQGKKYKKSFILTFVCFTISSLMISVIPYIQRLPDEIQKKISYTIAALFWLGIFSGLCSMIVISKRMSKGRKDLGLDRCLKHQRLPGIITFSKKKSHLILYIITTVGAMSIIFDLSLHVISEYLMFPIISITFLTFVVHCIIDGKCYKTYILVKEGTKNDDKSK